MKLNKSEIIAIILVIVSTVGVIVASIGYRKHTTAEIELSARAPERGNWDPQEIKVKKGEPVKIVLRNEDGVTHGFYLPAFDIIVREIKAGHIEKVEFTPNAAGEFGFYCNVWCGNYHMQMRGKLIVEE